MNASPLDVPELERLIEAVRDERIDAAQVARLEEILRQHAEARRYYRRAMRLQGYLEQSAATVPTPQQTSESPVARRADRRRRAGWIAAAAAIAVCLGLAAWLFGPALLNGPDRQAGPPDEQPDGPGQAGIALSPAWTIEPTGAADYTILDEAVLRLDRGELLVRSVGDAPPELVIRTSAGNVSASGTQFLVGYHPSQLPSKKEPQMRPLIRVLVISGVVTLANVHGSVTGGGNELLAATEQSAPTRQVVRANSDFAVDLYRQLAKEDDRGNVFFSPLSVSIALAMTAEGARGETAREMGLVLRWPNAMQRLGDDAQRIPWQTSAVHSGLSSLGRMLNRQQDTPEKQAIRRQIQAMERELKTLNERNARLLRERKDRQAFREGFKEARQVADKLNELYPQVDQYELNVANSLWADLAYPLAPQFVDTVTGSYDTGAVRAVDFQRAPEQQRLRINGWVADQTRQRIKDLLPEGSVDDTTRMVLASAVYFRGDWKSPFDTSRTEEQDFLLAGGDTVQTPMMRNRSMDCARYGAFTADGSPFDTPHTVEPGEPPTRLYPDENGFAVVELPYRGDDLAMVVIAPNRADGLADIERRLEGETLERWIGQLQQRKVHVYLPKFKAETGYRLARTLEAMGMVRAFDPNLADFSGMTASGGSDLYLAAVFHKAFVDVNEEGTEAAAATGAMKSEPSAPAPTGKPFTPTFRADRPFLFLIHDRPTGSILFLGRIMQP